LTGVQWYVVDYDIPFDENSNESKARHMQFYRRLWKILRTANIEIRKKSTASVWILDDEAVALQIHELACVYGVSHWYQALRMD
jgi:hypothetical protein